MRQFFLILSYFTDVVQKTGAFGSLHVEAKFSRHRSAEFGGLNRVLQQVLAIAGAVLHAANHLNQFGVKVVDTEVDGSTLTRLHNLLIHLLFHFMHHFLDAGRVDTSVDDQLLQ